MRTLRSHLKISKTIIWDFDGVIADTEPLQEVAFKRTLNSRRISYEDDFFKRFVGSPEVEIWRRLIAKRAIKEASIPELISARSKIYLELASHIHPAWYVAPILEESKLLSINNIIVSSGSKHHILTLLSHWGLTEFFSAIYCNGLPEELPLENKYDRLEFVKTHYAEPFMIIEDNIDYLNWALNANMCTVAIAHSLNVIPDSGKWAIKLPISRFASR